MARILIIEDYPNLQKMYYTVLTEAGHEVLQATDGAEAGVIVANSEPDLILLDLLLPNVDGLRFLRDYDLSKHPKTKAIVFSNMSSPELAKEASELGASRYLIKANFTPKELVGVVDEILHGRSPKAQAAS